MTSGASPQTTPAKPPTEAGPERQGPRLGEQDPNSFANVDDARVTHIHLDWNIDFDRQNLEGSATLTVEKVNPEATSVVLDNRKLLFRGITDDATGKPLMFSVGEHGYVGARTEIALPKSSEKTVKINIRYKTDPMAGAIQWLTPKQTAGKTHPYMFTQCQAIHCRSMVPLQDTPAVKATYSAEVTAPKDITVLMSAVPQGEPEPVFGRDGTTVVARKHRFEQKIPIQSYLIALAAGKLESRRIGPRSTVWTEAEFIEEAAEEFSETENMLKTAEDLCGPYVWGIYDILVLPPFFPYGGMENPCLTFATPTLLAGDKSLANVIAHEIAHSWTGNLVTNKNFEHFWLNEGFTVFTERKIVGRLKGQPSRDFSAIGGWEDLKYQISVMGDTNPFTSLVVDLTGVDPDDAFSSVPYEKGNAFLWYLEEIVGGPDEMEPFLKSYYEHFKFKSIDSFQFKEFFLNAFKDKPRIKEIDWDMWFYEPGMPKIKPNYDASLAQACIELKDRWCAWDESGDAQKAFPPEEFEALTPAQKIEFLAMLLDVQTKLSHKKLETMEQLYKLNDVRNCEIRFRWIRLGLIGHWEDAVQRAVEMVTEQGRMKYLRPLYRDLFLWPGKQQIAVDTWISNKASYMKVANTWLKKNLAMANRTRRTTF